jgi:hypothetical protein
LLKIGSGASMSFSMPSSLAADLVEDIEQQRQQFEIEPLLV